MANAEPAAMNMARTISHELNEGHGAKTFAEKAHASENLMASFHQLLGPSVSHETRTEALKDVFKMDPQAEAQIREQLPNLQIVHDKNGVDVDKTVTQLEKHPSELNVSTNSNVPANPDIIFAPYENLSLNLKPAAGTSDNLTPIPTAGPELTFPAYENLMHNPATAPGSHETEGLYSNHFDNIILPAASTRFDMPNPNIDFPWALVEKLIKNVHDSMPQPHQWVDSTSAAGDN